MVGKALKYRWPHLIDEQKRGSILYSYIEKYLGNIESVLDMNCGFAPLYPFLADKLYFGFDNNEQAIRELREKYRGAQWQLCSDNEWDKDIQVDLLLLLGMGAGLERGESKTEIESLGRLAKKYNPKIIIVEIADGHKKNHWYKVPQAIPEYVLEQFFVYDSRMNHCNMRLLKVYMHEDSYNK